MTTGGSQCQGGDQGYVRGKLAGDSTGSEDGSVLEEKFLSACARKDCLSVSLGLSKDLESETFPVNGDIRYQPDQCLHGAACK